MKIILEHIGKSFDGREVLKDLDYVFDADRPVVVKGASGTGKTTLLRIIGGLLSPDKGSVKYEGVERGKCRFAPMFQEQRLIDHLNAVENIRLVCRGMPDTMIADELTKLIPESEILKRAGELSGGTARRVEVAGGEIGLVESQQLVVLSAQSEREEVAHRREHRSCVKGQLK